VASRHGTILPSYQIQPSRSAIDMEHLLGRKGDFTAPRPADPGQLPGLAAWGRVRAK
jgi:hypothetical protein